MQAWMFLHFAFALILVIGFIYLIIAKFHMVERAERQKQWKQLREQGERAWRQLRIQIVSTK